MNYYAQKKENVLHDLHVTAKGLSDNQVHVRKDKYGDNILEEAQKVSPIALFLSQFNNVVMYILIVAVGISAVLKEFVDAVVILIILILIGVLGFVQEYRAEQAIAALKKMASLQAKVIREGKKEQVDAKDLVPGDIICLESGDKVPADARLLTTQHLQVQEAALTGESTAVTKNEEAVTDDTPLAERKSMVFSGTLIVTGKATAVITHIGMETEMGKIARLIQEAKPEPTPLQKKMDQLGRLLGMITLVVAAIVFFTGLFVHQTPPLEMLIFAVSLAVAAIPEGLAAVVTIALALGTKRMLKRHALVRRLPSVETLGSTTVICTDKTGTLTLNQMTVKKMFVNDHIVSVSGSGYETKGNFSINGKTVDPNHFTMLLQAGALNNDAELKDSEVIGDPTEGALIVSAAKAGLSQRRLNSLYPRIDEIEFSSERKMMTTVHDNQGEKVVYVKGAPERVLKLCKGILIDGQIKHLTPKGRTRILKMYDEFADEALRVMGFAYKSALNDRTDKNMIFLGLQAMIDPPRPEVKQAIADCNSAGIKVMMITGDHETTANAVARDIGLTGKSMTGAQLASIKNLSGVIEDYSVLARVDPEHKLRVVDALKKNGHVVAMTGDGVNDAPALKKADIGIAMGITGTDVSKEASSIVLTDDNFASIVNSVEEGRGTYDNIRKYFSFLLSGNIGEVLIIFLGMVMGLPLPLTVTQILLINLITDGLPALALSVDPFEPKAMKRKPRSQREPIYSGLKPYLIIYPAVLTVSALTTFIWIYNSTGNVLKAQTATFVMIAMFELYQAFACRSTIYPSLEVGLFKNNYLLLAVFASFAIVASTVFIPQLQTLLGMFPLSVMEFLAISAFSVVGAISIEISKMLICRKREKQQASLPA